MKLRQWKDAAFPRGVRRDTARLRSRLLRRTSASKLVRAFRELGLPTGAVVGIHARLSTLGYLPEGAVSVFRALQEAVPDCTIFMPTFPFSRTTVRYLADSPVFDASSTPSASGLLSEALRTFPGVLRSRHPTHPCAAVGPAAAELIRGSQAARTPFGDDSAYGRYTSHPRAFHLLLDTNSTSIVHRFQEIVGTPNLFLDEEMEARSLDADGAVKTYRVRVHRPLVPLHVAVPDGEAGKFQYVWMPDYCLLFPAKERDSALRGITRSDTAKALSARDDAFARSGVFRTTRIRSAEIRAIAVEPWLTEICRELAANLHQYPQAYELERVKTALRSMNPAADL